MNKVNLCEAINKMETSGQECIKSKSLNMKIVLREKRLYTVGEQGDCGIGLRMHYWFLMKNDWEFSDLTERQRNLLEISIEKFRKNADVWNASTL